MQKKKLSLLFLLAGTVVVGLTACGGGGGSGAGASTGGIFGKIPAIVYQKTQQDSVRNAKFEKKFKDVEKMSEDEQKVFGEKMKKEYDDAEAQYKADFAKEGETLVGKSVPFMVAEGLDYNVSNLVITKVDDSGRIEAEYDLTIHDGSKLKTGAVTASTTFLDYQLVNKSGEIIKKEKGMVFIESGHQSDTQFKETLVFSINKKNTKEMADVAKVAFVAGK